MIKRVVPFVAAMNTNGQSHKHYKELRHAFKPEEDNIIGKLGEITCYHFLRTIGFPKGELDFEIRKGRKKKWIQDIRFFSDTYPDYHVKTCSYRTTVLADDYTWTFQLKDSTGWGRDPLLDKPDSEELIAFMYISDTGEDFDSRIIVTAPWRYVYKVLRKPLLKKYEDVKLCVYYKDLINLR